MKKILIQVATEFHYFVALSIIEKYYSDAEYDIHFILSKNPASKSRLESIKLNEAYTYHVISFSIDNNEVYDDVTGLLNFVKQNDFHHFVSFLFHHPLFIYFSYYFKNKKTATYLAPDGLAAYVKFTSSTIRSRIVYTIAVYKFFKRHNMKFNKLWLVNWNFGKNGDYDFVYAFSKSLPYLNTKKEVIEIDYTLSDKNLKALKETFSVDLSKYPTGKKTILIINDRHKIGKYETQLIELLKETFPEYNVLYKKHPNQPENNLDYLSDYDNVYKIFEVFPVELLIASLEGGIIISSYTTSMLYNNPKCHYFWTYPIVVASNELKKPIKRHNPKDYITITESFEELKQNLLEIANAD